MHSRRALARTAPLEEQKPHRNITAEQQRSLDSAYNDHSTKALNNLITNRASEARTTQRLRPTNTFSSSINRPPSMSTTPSTSSRDPAVRVEVGGRVRVDIRHVVG